MTEKTRITRVELGQTQDGKSVAHLYAPGPRFAKYPFLVLFNPGLLMQVGIDPNCIGDGVHCDLWGHYELSKKLNGKGKPYKNITALEAINAPTAPDHTTAIMGELKAIKALLLELATSNTPPEPEPTPDTDKAKAERIRTLAHIGESDQDQGADADVPAQPTMTQTEGRTKFYELAGPAIAAGSLDARTVNDLSNEANGSSWPEVLAKLQAVLGGV